MPAFVLGPSLGVSYRSLMLGRARGAVLGREHDVAAMTEHFVLGVTKQALSSLIPSRDVACNIHGEDGEVRRAFDRQPQKLVASRRSWSGWPALHIRCPSYVRHPSLQCGLAASKCRGDKFLGSDAHGDSRFLNVSHRSARNPLFRQWAV